MLAGAFVAMLVIVHALNATFDFGWQRFGVHPREWRGLVGVLLAPFLHADLGHLASNAWPLLVLGTVTLYLFPRSARPVLAAIYVGSGFTVWLLGRDSIHIGASGLVYGLAAFVFTSGVLRRDRRALAAALLVAFLYGAMIWGVLPLRTAVSWETHLAAACLGVVLAFIHRDVDRAPVKRYAWEGKDDGEDEDDWEDGYRRQDPADGETIAVPSEVDPGNHRPPSA